jgi:pilus assembly protein CpaB
MKKAAPLIIALVLGLAAAYLAMNMSKKPGQSLISLPAAKPQIVVAKTNYNPGDVLTDEGLEVVDAPDGQAPDGSFKASNEIFGRVVGVRINAGQPVVATLLAPKGMPSGIAAIIPMGMRAVTIEISELTGVAGYLVPGCHVDMMQTMHLDSTGNDQISKTLLQNIEVIAVGMRHGPDGDGGGRSVTLLVNPVQAEAVELMSMSGRTRLALRGGNDLGVVQARGITLAELRGEKPKADIQPVVAPSTTQPSVVQAVYLPATQPAAADDIWTIQVIRGDAASNVKFNLHKDPSEVQSSTDAPDDTLK